MYYGVDEFRPQQSRTNGAAEHGRYQHQLHARSGSVDSKSQSRLRRPHTFREGSAGTTMLIRHQVLSTPPGTYRFTVRWGRDLRMRPIRVGSGRVRCGESLLKVRGKNAVGGHLGLAVVRRGDVTISLVIRPYKSTISTSATTYVQYCIVCISPF